MSYVPTTEADRQAMLAEIGVRGMEDLFADVPREVRYPELKLPPPLSELEIMAELQAMSEGNADLNHYACFLGAGAYHHFIPSAVDQLASRSEFYTAYTPYQPEVSQGTLQAIFEYQSMMAELLDMDVVNASHYDGATALAEAALMAIDAGKGRRRKVILSPAIHPECRATLRTYFRGTDLQIAGDEKLDANLDELKAMVDDNTAALMIQNPNFFGKLEEVRGLADFVHDRGALLVVSIYPISLGLLEPPGAYGADIVTGEGQSLGVPLSFGGPYLGIFACQQAYVRKLPGRIVGQTVDTQGTRGFVNTLSTREQHIRREKATSNICTNEGLVALTAGVYLALMGKTGLRKVAELCYHKAHYAAKMIGQLPGFKVDTERPFFNEFVVHCPIPPRRINERLLEKKIICGYELGKDYPYLQDAMLVCVTEMNSRAEINRLVDALREVGS
jgi:glycine dehydrogenase subunit 1